MKWATAATAKQVSGKLNKSKIFSLDSTRFHSQSPAYATEKANGNLLVPSKSEAPPRSHRL